MNSNSIQTHRRGLASFFLGRTRKVLLAALAGVLLAVAAQAHHSFAAQYDINKPVRLVGALTKIEWTNPHSYFYLNVKNSKGELTEWTIETAGPGALSRRGFKKGTIKLGDTLIVDGYLAKNGGTIIDGRRVTLPDGTVVNGGTAGDGGPGSEVEAAPAPKQD
jgi:hypothetical protein